MGEHESAYDYGNKAEQDERQHEKQLKPAKNPHIVMKETEAKSGSVITIIFVSVLAAVLLGSVIYSFDRRNTAYNSVAAKNQELTLIEAENVRLQSELESRLSAKNVEDYAENVLGMTKVDSSQIEYIKIQTDDVVSIPQPEENILSKIKDFFERCVEYFRG
jgi:cell division protein FtsL